MQRARSHIIVGVVAAMFTVVSCSNQFSEPRFWKDECPLDGAGVLFNTDQGPQEVQLPSSFAPVSVTRCSQDLKNNEYWVREQEAPLTEDLRGALQLPDTALPPDVTCNARAPESGILFVLLVDREGRALRPKIPLLGGCEPRTEIQESLKMTPFVLRKRFQVDPSSFPT